VTVGGDGDRIYSIPVTTGLTKDFAAAIAGPDHAVDLFGAAIVIARLGGSRPDEHACLRTLDLWAEAALEHAGATRDPGRLAHAVDWQLFSVLGFHGATENYNDPVNSYLSEVIDRRAGIPITLSLVYMEIAQRIGLRADGVGYPRHFIVRCGDPEEPIYVDPFHQGARLDREELLAGLRGMELGSARPESFLAAVTRRQMLQRMLNNLHTLFRQARDIERWLQVVELKLCIEPWNAQLVGERGMLYYRTGEPQRALADLERYVEAAERAGVHAGALRLLDELRLRFGGTEEDR
jgi:regulator of sirC expression with transglutaminase-like and TPR domain